MAEGMPGGRGGNERREGQMEGRAFFLFLLLTICFFPCVLGLRCFLLLHYQREWTSRDFFSVGTFCRVPVIAGAFFSRSTTTNYYIALATWDAVLFSFPFYLVIMRLHGKATRFGHSAWQRLHHDMVESFFGFGWFHFLLTVSCPARFGRFCFIVQPREMCKTFFRSVMCVRVWCL